MDGADSVALRAFDADGTLIAFNKAEGLGFPDGDGAIVEASVSAVGDATITRVIVDYSELRDNGTAIDNLTFLQEASSTSAAAVTDSDGDGVPDDEDAFPDDENENGIGDNSEADSDGDGFTNGEEATSGSDPDDPASIPSAQAIKGLVLATLDPFVDESKKIGKAVREIVKSLEKGWLDDSTLDPKHGKKVFDRQKKAAKELRKAIDGHKNEVLSDEAAAAATDAIARLVAESRSLVGLDALVELTSIDPNKQDKVEKELAKGDALLEDRPDKAIGYYKKAWQHAEHAEKHAAKEAKPPKEPKAKKEPKAQKPPKAPKDAPEP